MIEINSRVKSVLITGGTSGLGLELVRLFLKNGYNVVAVGRQLLRIPGFEHRFKLIPEIDQKEKEAFRVACYNLIAPYLKHSD